MSTVALLQCQRVRPNVREARWHNWDLLRETMYLNGNQVDTAP
jgi:hypothetical protein